MQVFTPFQIGQLQATAIAAYDALVIVEDTVCSTLDRVLVALTSDRAVQLYQTGWAIARYTLMMSMAAAFYSGVLARRLWEAWQVQAAALVHHCERPELSIIDSCNPEPQSPPETESLPIIDSEEAISQPTTAPIKAMTTHQLRKYATGRGIKGAGRWNKAKLLEVLAS